MCSIVQKAMLEQIEQEIMDLELELFEAKFHAIDDEVIAKLERNLVQANKDYDNLEAYGH